MGIKLEWDTCYRQPTKSFQGQKELSPFYKTKQIKTIT